MSFTACCKVSVRAFDSCIHAQSRIQEQCGLRSRFRITQRNRELGVIATTGDTGTPGL
jgi:hypothetical protein